MGQLDTNQLPPELVEKMSQHVDLYNNKGQIDHELSWKRAEQCAQIAVDYADEYKYRYKIQLAVNEELRSQRDELLEALKRTTSLGYQQKTHHNDKKWRQSLENNEQLIQKYDVKHD